MAFKNARIQGHDNFGEKFAVWTSSIPTTQVLIQFALNQSTFSGAIIPDVG
jgi:hypothetical protein